MPPRLPLRVSVSFFARFTGSMFITLLLVMALTALPRNGFSQAATPIASNWTQASPAASPSARFGQMMAYDSVHGTVVLFGGFGSSNVQLGDTWLWNGTTWTQQSTPTSPSPRNNAGMAFDAATGNTVLFGGFDGVNYLSDTWIWNGSSWAKQNPGASPSNRALTVMAYDPATSSVVLFGGSDMNGVDQSDTWSWNGSTWSNVAVSNNPPPRASSALAYNPVNGTLVLFGGVNSTHQIIGDTWVYNGTTWAQQTPATSPGVRTGAAMVYDASTGTDILFGGANNAGNVTDTWSWNGTTWTQQTTPASPTGVYYTNMAYDAATSSVVQFGGENYNVGTDVSTTWNFQQAAYFGTVAVGGNATSTATFNVTTAGTMGTPLVLTGGSPNLDFTLGTGSTCTGSVAVGSCTVSVAFGPLAPGQRLGAVELTNSTGGVLATALISGIGSGPLATLSPGTITTFAGNGTAGYVAAQDGGAAPSAELNYPWGVAVDAGGNLFIADNSNNRIRKVTAANGVISTVAGNGTYGYVASQDGGPATSAELDSPTGVTVDGAGNLYIADQLNSRIRKVTLAGIITTVAGNGSTGYQAAQDGGPATSAYLYYPTSVVVDGAGNFYIADTSNSRIRKVTSGGIISTVAGNGTAGYVASQDGGLATNAELNQPRGVALDSAGNLYIADTRNQRIRLVSAATGLITTVAGNGTAGYVAAQDGGAATSAELDFPDSVTVDAAGDLYIADTNSNRLRKVAAATGIITTLAGKASSGYLASQDGGPASAAELFGPVGIAVDGVGNVYVGDNTNQRIRKISVKSEISFPTATAPGSSDTTDGTQTGTLNNIGNLPLTIASMGNATSGSFVLANPMSGGCTTAVAVAIGGSCLLGEQFAPAVGSSGGVSNSLVVTDNSLNVTGTVQSVPLLGTTVAGSVTVSVSAPSVVAHTASDTITVIVGYSGTASDTGAITVTVNGSATGIGTPTCTAKGGHVNCAYPYTGTALTSGGSYPIAVSVASDSNYSAGSATGTLTVTSPAVIVRPVAVGKPVVSAANLK